MSDFREVTFSPLASNPENGEDPGLNTHNDESSPRIMPDSAENGEESKVRVNFPVGHSSYLAASFNFINSIVGAGIIGRNSGCFSFE
jgi:hypothetical protein